MVSAHLYQCRGLGQRWNGFSQVLWFGKKHTVPSLDGSKEQQQGLEQSQPKLCFFVNHIFSAISEEGTSGLQFLA